MSEFLQLLTQRDPAAIAGWRGVTPVSVGELRARAAAWRALALRTPGGSVALFLDDSLEFVAALMGVWQAGKTVWLTADNLDASCAALARSVDAFFGAFPACWLPSQPLEGETCDAPWRAIDPGFDALVVHTSGSTGAPQAIPKRLSQLMSEVITLEAVFGAAIGDADVVATVSHQHIYGLLFKVLWPLHSGRAVHALSFSFPEQLAQVMGRRPCVLVASPAHLKRLPEHLEWTPSVRNLRAVFCSGGPLAPEAGMVVERLLGRLPIEIYGSSETGGIAWRQRQPASPGAWKALPGVEWRIAAVGDQLEVRSPHLQADGWMQLADRGQAAGATGFLLLGRSDRLVKIEEKRISLDAIEAALLATGLAVQARVIVCGEAPGERQALAAFVVPSKAGRMLLASGKPALNQALRAHLSTVVEAVALPRRWRYLDQMPADAQGKTTYASLAALLGEAPDARPRTPRISIIEQDAQRVLFELVVPSNLLYLDGHFTQAPVLPGVVQVDWAILYGRRHFALAPSFRGINALKFQHLIQPGMPVRLELTHDPVQGSLSFRYFSDAGQHAGGRILFGL